MLIYRYVYTFINVNVGIYVFNRKFYIFKLTRVCHNELTVNSTLLIRGRRFIKLNSRSKMQTNVKAKFAILEKVIF